MIALLMIKVAHAGKYHGNTGIVNYGETAQKPIK
jgi:hypothetical protein